MPSNVGSSTAGHPGVTSLVTATKGLKTRPTKAAALCSGTTDCGAANRRENATGSCQNKSRSGTPSASASRFRLSIPRLRSPRSTAPAYDRSSPARWASSS